MSSFLDRVRETEAIRKQLGRQGSLTLVYGQRRTGKTFLLQHVAGRDADAIYFLADETSSPDLLRRFLVQAGAWTRAGSGLSPTGITDWGTALALLFQEAHVARRRLVLVIDECQYLLDREPALPSILQRLWDQFLGRARVHVLLCGSALGTLSKLGEGSQPLHGRFDLKLHLDPFSFRESALFVPRWTAIEKLRLYGVFGGLARHLAAVDPGKSLERNVCEAILEPLSPLHEAPQDMLRAERVSSTAEAAAVVEAVASGENRFNAIASRTGLKASRLDYVVKELMELDIVEKEVRFGDKPGSKLVRYRCRDPFVEFWFRFVGPNRSALQSAPPESVWRQRILPGFDSHMGSVFERLVAAALRAGLLADRLGPADEVAPFWSRDGQTQIDAVARFGRRLLFVECKWRSGSKAGTRVLDRLREHAAHLPGAAAREPATYCVASARAFSSGLRKAAAREGVILLDGRDLLAARPAAGSLRPDAPLR